MFGSMKTHLARQLDEIRQTGLYKTERVITSPQDARIRVGDSQPVLNLCANNYLGLAAHPAVVKAAHEALDQWGYGLSSVRFICGTQNIHKQLEARISEFLGVALFALALIWLIALVTYEPTDPVWFFTTDALHPPANFVGRVGAFLSELSFQLLGYAAYLLPGVIAWAGWYYFWCQPFEAISEMPLFRRLRMGQDVAHEPRVRWRQQFEGDH